MISGHQIAESPNIPMYLSRIEVDCHDRIAQVAAKLRDRNVARVGRIPVERGAVAEQDDDPRIVRPRRTDEVGADLEIENTVDVCQRLQPRTMVLAGRLAHVLAVPETHQMHNHYNSSPSMSSSPASTTTLWMSTVNHSRNVFRSRGAGHADSSSVHVESCSSNSHDAFSSTHSSTSSSSSNSGNRTTVPYGLARGTVNVPLLASASWDRIHSTNGRAPTRLTAVRLTTRITGDLS